MTTATITLFLALLSPPTELGINDLPPADASPIGQCDPRDGEPIAWTAAQRKETRARVRAACVELGAADIVCDYLDAVTVRESSGRASKRHQRAEGEDGLGPMGLSLRSHANKWPGDDEDPQFCSPEVSVLVALSIMRAAITRYNARDLAGIQSIYGGHWRCEWEATGLEGKKYVCFPTTPKPERICERMAQYGENCWETITTKMLGRRVKVEDRREVAEELIRAAREKSRANASDD